MDTSSPWNTGEVDVQPHRPSEKKRSWDKEKTEAPVDSPAPLSLAEESPAGVTELLRSGGWESVPSEASPVVETVAPVMDNVIPQEDTRPEWVRESESINFVNPPSSSSPETWEDSGVEPADSKSGTTVSVAASAVDVLFDSTGEKSRISTRDRLTSPRPRPRFVGQGGSSPYWYFVVYRVLFFNHAIDCIAMCGIGGLLCCSGGVRHRSGWNSLDGDGSSSVAGLS